ncbi:MAG: hypothetical protein M0T73_09375 [Deltaproteobacteria bacterium]|nr:hypothetical protein [Deltaproteobacteria bacterium]
MRINDITEELEEKELLALMVFPELVGGLSHEVAQPLNAISLACEVIRFRVERLPALNETDLNFFRDKLAGIKTQVLMAADKISGIRRYGSKAVNSSAGDIEASFLRVSNLLRQQFISRGIEFIVQNHNEGPVPTLIDDVVLDLTIAECIVFARTRVEFLDSRHKEHNVPYEKRIEALLNRSPGPNSMVIKWNRGALQMEDLVEFIPPRVKIGLSASKKIIGRFGGTIQIDEDGISLFFQQTDSNPQSLG